MRRGKELQQLASLTGWEVSGYSEYKYNFYDYELPSQPEMRKTITPKSQTIFPDDIKGSIEDEKVNDGSFQPVYATTEPKEDQKDYATMAFIAVSLLMLVGVMKSKG